MALEKLGIKVNNYFVSEIDKYANQAAELINPKTIFCGCVTKIKYKDGVLYTENGEHKTKIDLILAGSPCQGFSFAGKRLNFEDQRSKLFFDFVRILEEVKKENEKVFYLLENVRMSKKSEQTISNILDIEPLFINSKLLSAQSRPRLYWTNIGAEAKTRLFGPKTKLIPQPKDKGILLIDVLEKEVDEKYFLSKKTIKTLSKQNPKHGFKFQPTTGEKKAKCLTARCFKLGKDDKYIICGASRGRYTDDKTKKIYQKLELRNDKKTNCLTSVEKDNYLFYNDCNFKTKNIRKLTPRECFRLQTIPEKHINTLINSKISNTQLYKMAGNGWTVDVIEYILSYM
jgi:DNA (cytosine-5)-methyltransferase 3A